MTSRFWGDSGNGMGMTGVSSGAVIDTIIAGPDTNNSISTPSAGVSRVTKNANGGTFNAGAYGSLRAGDFRYKLVLVAFQDTMIGVNTAPAAGSNYTDMAHQIYCAVGGSITAYDAAVAGAALGSYTSGDTFWVDRTGTTLTFWKGAVYATATLLRTTTQSGSVALDLSMATLSSVVDVTPIS